MTTFDIVVAADLAGGIGRDGQLPWKLAGDMAFFKSLTAQTSATGRMNAVIMGRKTWDSIPTRFRPLVQRFNIVVSRNADLQLDAGVALAPNLDAALDIVTARGDAIERTFVIGGGAIYQLAVQSTACRQIYLTRVHARFNCDVFFPDLDERYERIRTSPPQEDGGTAYVFETYQRTP